jgi:hypothetical protein
MFPDNLGALNAEQLNARHHIHPQFAQLPELAPYPISTGVLGMSYFLPLSICEHLFTFPTAPPASEKFNAALAQKKVGTTKSKPTKTTAKGAKRADGRSVSESETDTSDSELEIEEPEEPSPPPQVRPADADGAAQYDSIKAVWSPRNRRPKAEKIKASLVAFKDVVKAVRDEWKTLSQAMKDAENQNDNDKAAELKKKVIQQRQIMNVVVSTTLDKGHGIIIEKYVHSPSPSCLTYLADLSLRGCRTLMRNENYHHVIISIWIFLKKIMNCRIMHTWALRVYAGAATQYQLRLADFTLLFLNNFWQSPKEIPR